MTSNKKYIELCAVQLVAQEVKNLLTNIEENDETECFGVWTENGNMYLENEDVNEEVRQRAKELSETIELDVDILIQKLYGNVLV